MYHQLGNLAIHYQSFGEGKPILILPGWGINAEATAQYMEAFFQDRPGWQRIYLDPPGHGKTVIPHCKGAKSDWDTATCRRSDPVSGTENHNHPRFAVYFSRDLWYYLGTRQLSTELSEGFRYSNEDVPGPVS